MDSIIRVASRVLFPAIMVFGVYVAVHGHLSPGGAFPAGVILASGFAILLLTHGKGDPRYEILKNNKLGWKNGLEMLAMISVIMFGYVWLRGYLMGTQKFLELWSGGYTIILNTLSVFFIFTAFSSIIYAMVKE
jgi:multicomponent Na+:H+ antiporter subunit B